MIVVIVGRESMASSNTDHIPIRNCPSDKKLCQDPTEVFFVLGVLSLKSLGLFSLNK
jgi:hypothetical protein